MHKAVQKVRLRTLHVVPSIDLQRGAGLGASAFTLHKQMLEEGFDSQLYTLETGANGYLTERDIVCPPAFSNNPFFFNPGSFELLNKLIANVDVVHQHGLYTHLNWCVGKCCATQKKLLVCHPHGTLAPWYLRRRRLQKRIVHWLFENRNFARTDLWRAVTVVEAKEIRAFVPKAKIVVVPNGIRAEDFPSHADSNDKSFFHGLDSTRRWLLFFGRVVAVKGVDILISAWEALPQFHDRWQLVIAGPDCEGYLREAQRQISRFSASAMPVFTGPLHAENKLRMLNAADLFILPSRAEGFSVAALEAMAARKPVILSQACNFPEIELQAAGWICRAEIEGIRNVLTEALQQSDADLKHRGELARSLIERKYTWRRAVELLNQATHACNT